MCYVLIDQNCLQMTPFIKNIEKYRTLPFRSGLAVYFHRSSASISINRTSKILLISNNYWPSSLTACRNELCVIMKWEMIFCICLDAPWILKIYEKYSSKNQVNYFVIKNASKDTHKTGKFTKRYYVTFPLLFPRPIFPYCQTQIQIKCQHCVSLFENKTAIQNNCYLLKGPF